MFGKKTVVRILCAAIVVSLSGCAAKKEPIKLSLKAGDKRTVSLKSNQHVSMNAMGMNMDTSNGADLEFDLTVTAVDEAGTADIDVNVRRYSLTNDSSMKAMMGGGDPMSAIGSAIEGKKFTMRLTPYGSIESIGGWDAIKADIQQKMGASGPGGAGVPAGFLDQVAGEDLIRGQMEGLFAVYRTDPAGKGDTWSKTVSEVGVFPVSVETKYTLVDRAGGYSTVESIGTLKANESMSGPMAQLGVSMKMDFKGEQKGVVKIEDATGWVVRDESDLNFSGDMSIDMKNAPAGMAMPNGGKIPMTITGKRVVESFPT
jgi:hypothetical protein